MVNLFYIIFFTGYWTELREVNQHVTGDVAYTVLYRKEKLTDRGLLSPCLKWTYQIVVISPSDTTDDRLKALDRELRRDNAGIWSVSIEVYDDEAAARQARWAQNMYKHRILYLDYLDDSIARFD